VCLVYWVFSIHKGAKKEVSDLNLIRRFEVSVLDDVKILTKKGTGLRYVAAEDMHEIFVSRYIAMGHEGRDVMRGSTWVPNSTISLWVDQISCFLNFWEECQLFISGSFD
jgi:hypothetical protein